MRILLNLNISWKRIDNFIILRLPIHEHGVSSFRPSFMSSKFLTFSIKGLGLVRFTHGYFIFIILL